MGWNDHFDPSEYDASSLESMRQLADKAMASRSAVATVSQADQEWLDSLPTGECWNCGASRKLVGKGLCTPCWKAEKT